jgi:CRISPR/Cas system-associated endonuclease Cas3-HD
VFGVHYDMLAWTWAIPDEKLARMCMLLEEAMAAKQIRSWYM